VEAIDKGHVLHGLGQRLKEVVRLDQHVDGDIDVPDEYHRRVRNQLLSTTG